MSSCSRIECSKLPGYSSEVLAERNLDATSAVPTPASRTTKKPSRFRTDQADAVP